MKTGCARFGKRKTNVAFRSFVQYLPVLEMLY